MSEDRQLVVVWMGFGGNRHHAEGLYPIVHELGMKLRIISEWDPNSDHPDVEYVRWNLNTWKKDLQECDIAIAPQDVELQPCKSNVKVTTYMAAGLPVVASPLRAYRELVQAGFEVAFSVGADQWGSCLRYLRDTPLARKDQAAHNLRLMQDWNQQIADKWIDVIKTVAGPTRPPKQLALSGTPSKVVPVAIKQPSTQGKAARRVALIYGIPQLGLRSYQSYGDHWLDACEEVFGEKKVEHFANIVDLQREHPDPDFFFFIEFNPEWLSLGIGDGPGPRILYAWDSHLHMDGFLHRYGDGYIEQFLKRFDYVFLANKRDVDRLRGNDWDNVYWIPPGCNPNVHRPVPSIVQEFDIGFIGQQDDSIPVLNFTRKRYLVELDNAFKAFIGQNFWGADYNDWLNRCKYIFDCRTHAGWGTRIFEGMAMGKAVLTNQIEPDLLINGMPTPDLHFLQWRSREELMYLVTQYCDESRQEMESLALNESRNHTYAKRLEQMLEIIGSRLRKEKEVVREQSACAIIEKPVTKRLSKQAEVTVIIPVKDQHSYTHACLDSLKGQDVSTTIIVVDNYTDDSVDYTESVDYIVGPVDPLNFTESVNAGIDQWLELPENEKGQYVLILNNDVVFPQNSLRELINAVSDGDFDMACPISNCDKDWKHIIQFVMPDNRQEIGIGITIDDIQSHRVIDSFNSDFIDQVPEELCRKTKPTDWIAFYCAIVRREVIEEVGKLDETMKMVCSDKDYCARAMKAGFRIGYDYGSFVLHYGAVTRKAEEKRDPAAYHEQDRRDQEALARKNRQRGDKFQIVSKVKRGSVIFYSGPSWETWTPYSLNEGGIGGSETCQIYVCKYLQQMGWDVVSIGEHGEDECYEGVNYFRYQKHHKVEDTADILVSVRQPHIVNDMKKQKRYVLWSHDCWYSNMRVDNFQSIARSYDKLVLLSSWHFKYWKEVYPNLDDNRIIIIPDGINIADYQDTPSKRAHNLIYASSWDRGLDALLNIVERVHERVQDCLLDVFYGTYNMEKFIRSGNAPAQLKEFFEQTKVKISSLPFVHDHGRVGQDELAKKFLTSNLWVYPTGFCETFCINALSAMAARCGIITRPLAALETTVFGGDRYLVKIEGDVHTKIVQDRYVEHILRTFEDLDKGRAKDFYEYRFSTGRKFAESHDWAKVVEKYWDPMLRELLGRVGR